MKKKNLLLAALALIALAGCTSDDFVGDGSPQVANGNGAISFSMSTPAVTRAENGGKTAATALSNRFIVWGEKNETNGDAATTANLVFKNYKVEWTDNSAYTSTSNTQNWEYVGLTPYTAAQVFPSINPTTQTIKYWDYNATSYTFTAVSALDADITGAKVIITKNTSGSDQYAKGYDIAVKSDASIDNIFIADRNNITKTTGTDRDASNAYGGNVKMTFRNFMSKIRFGIYENIPGYKVKITNVDYNSTNSTTTSKFGVDGKFLVAGDNTAYTVSYYSDNKATVAIKSGTTPNSVSYLETTKSTETLADCPILHTSPTAISESASAPTYNRTDGTYTTILPFPTNDGNMTVKLDFTLTSDDTGEIITVVDATAEIPAAYCQWLPNYAYTYILKLNDNTNGQIGGVTGLYPITFDAVEITDENGKAEYITTLSEPSITTIGVKDSKYSVGQNEYAASTDVYATVEDNHNLVTLTKGTNIWLYTVTATSPFTVTEAGVAEHLVEKPTMTAAQVSGAKVIPVDANASLTIQNTVPREDDVTADKTVGTNMVGKFTTATGIKYAIVYMKTAPTYYVSTGATYADATEFGTAKSAAVDGKLYSDEACTSEATTWANASTTYYQINGKTYTSSEFTDAGTLYIDAACTTKAESWVGGTTYYKPTKVKTKGVYAIKIVNCP